MRYTRYDFKKKNRFNFVFFLIVLLILFLAFILGTILFNFFGSSTKTPIKSSKKQNAIYNNSKNNNNCKFIAIQTGMFKDKNNAEKSINTIKNYGNPFSVADKDKQRVVLGIYTENEANKIIKTLSDSKVENSKITFTLTKKDSCDFEICEIINGYLQILNKLSDKDIKSIKTDNLKKWCNSLKKVDNKSDNIETLNKLKSNINKLPKEITKQEASTNYIFIYNILKNLANK
ncbi:SPOR domain-containing protein [Clostridium niameyense]|uniref:SPOR domain-containing protein n=1 Tax=Clostridium niameyense TaxID=1622073 RepID=A0A6M0R788_9CLOT|nr:SPOR domain-containing protein [Clostridium niameyense]NEZ45657.1 SPOR domain-containing protein [Clostridium niameyense]